MTAKEFATLLARVPVLPVLTIEDAAHAVPLARALAEGGLDVLEITLRTEASLAAIRAIAEALPHVVVGAGTLRDGGQMHAAIEAGARFLVSPGATEALLDAAEHLPVPYLPAAATPSEAMRLAERGYTVQKFFPAEPAGGTPMLKAMAAPLADIRFCPTGGIGPGNAAAYLACPNVVCVGGSWVAPAQAVRDGDWDTLTRLAREASALRS